MVAVVVAAMIVVTVVVDVREVGVVAAMIVATVVVGRCVRAGGGGGGGDNGNGGGGRCVRVVAPGKEDKVNISRTHTPATPSPLLPSSQPFEDRRK